MDLEKINHAIEIKNQAKQALKQIMGVYGHIHCTCADVGQHYAIWVEYTGVNGKKFTRQFSWSKSQPDHDGIRMQWIYDNFKEYSKYSEDIKQLKEILKDE